MPDEFSLHTEVLDLGADRPRRRHGATSLDLTAVARAAPVARWVLFCAALLPLPDASRAAELWLFWAASFAGAMLCLHGRADVVCG